VVGQEEGVGGYQLRDGYRRIMTTAALRVFSAWKEKKKKKWMECKEE